MKLTCDYLKEFTGKVSSKTTTFFHKNSEKSQFLLEIIISELLETIKYVYVFPV